MKKVGITLLTAFVGGAVALGGYKLVTHNNTSAQSIADQQQVYFASNVKTTDKGLSSAGAPDFINAASAVTPAVVHIEVTVERKASSSRSPLEDMFGDMLGGGGFQIPNQEPRTAQGSGSGVILTPDGYIITNNHVVEDAKEVSVILTDKRRYTAKVIGADPKTDIALIKIEASDLPIVKIGDSDKVQVGEWVLAVGYPLDLNTTVTAGIVSAKRRSINLINQATPEERYRAQKTGKTPISSGIESYIQTDAAINPGNSGGALVNTNGELIGINAAIASRTGNYEGYGFAIPVDLAKKVVEDLKKYGKVRRGFMGVTFQELNAQDAKKLEIKEIDGLYINGVEPDGAAKAVGIKKGDIIKKINGQIVMASADLQEQIGRLNPGDKVNITILRDGKEKDYEITLKEAPKALTQQDTDNQDDNSGKKGGRKVTYQDLGATFVPLNSKLKGQFGVKSGVIVNDVQDGGILENYDIPEGSILVKVNGAEVNSVEDVKKIMQKSGSSLDLLLITPDGVKQGIRITVGGE